MATEPHAICVTCWLEQSTQSLASAAPQLVQRLSRPDHRRNAQLVGADRHVGICAAELGDEPADAAGEDPVEARVGARDEHHLAGEGLRRVMIEATGAVTVLRVTKFGSLGGR
jgi:hypothetical protein